MKCNFLYQEEWSNTAEHCYALEVVCCKFGSGELANFRYTVEVVAHGKSGLILLRNENGGSFMFDAPEEAFKAAEAIAAQYPEYGDDRDCDYALAPMFTGIPRRDEQ